MNDELIPPGTADESDLARTDPRRWPLALAAAVAAGLLGAGFWLSLRFGADFEVWLQAVIEVIRGWGAWGALASIALMIVHSFVPFPAELLACANGAVYGAVVGAGVTWIGAMLGACLAFALVRRFGAPLVARLLSRSQHAKLDRWTLRQGTSALFFSRLIPVIAFNLINYAAALTGIGWWAFLWTTGLGILPMTILTAILGNRLLSIPAWAWGAVSAAVVLTGAVWYLARRRTGP